MYTSGCLVNAGVLPCVACPLLAPRLESGFGTAPSHALVIAGKEALGGRKQYRLVVPRYADVVDRRQHNASWTSRSTAVRAAFIVVKSRSVFRECVFGVEADPPWTAHAQLELGLSAVVETRSRWSAPATSSLRYCSPRRLARELETVLVPSKTSGGGVRLGSRMWIARSAPLPVGVHSMP